MTINPIVPPASLAAIARASLEDAARLIRHAQREKANGRPNACASLLAGAQSIIRKARATYARAMATLAARAQLAHKYAKTSGGRWLALVTVRDTSIAHTLPRAYGKRQSAQRAALRYIANLSTGQE